MLLTFVTVQRVLGNLAAKLDQFGCLIKLEKSGKPSWAH